MLRSISMIASLSATALLLATPGAEAVAPPTMSVTPFANASGNLLVDGGAEAADCTTDPNAVTTVPGWTVTAGSPNVMCYPAQGVVHPAQPSPGRAFFGPGPYGNAAVITQTASVSSAASAIDAAATRFELSGWLGGRAALPGRARVLLTFIGHTGAGIGQTVSLPTVTAAERHDRTGLLARAVTGPVPAGTRSMMVTVRFADTGGAPGYSQNAHEAGSADNLSLTISTPVKRPQLVAPPSTVPRFDHVFLIMMENTDGDKVLAQQSDMPFFHSLMAGGVTFANYHAVYHPSDENYLAIAGADTYARGATYWPDIEDPGRNIADELEAHGKSWKAYEQGMGAPCNASAATEFTYDPYYYPDDAPFINYTDVSSNPARCQAHLVDTNQLAADLQKPSTTPAFSWLAADDYYDGESAGNGNAGSRQVQDGWLDDTITPILHSPAWQTQRSLLIVTWDEDVSSANNPVATVVVGSQGTVRAGHTSDQHYNHYSTGRTIEDALGLAPLTANDEYATPFNDAFRGGSA